MEHIRRGDRVIVKKFNIEGTVRIIRRGFEFPIGVILDEENPDGGLARESDWVPVGKANYMWIGEANQLRVIGRKNCQFINVIKDGKVVHEFKD